MKNKVVSKAMREKAEEALTEIQNFPNGMLRLVKGVKTCSKGGGRCMRVSDGKLCLSDKERGKVWKDDMERIMNDENDWDHNVEGDAVEGLVVCVSREDVFQALNEMKTGKGHGPSEVSLELVAASGGIGIQVMAEICQSPRWIGMPAEWALSIVVPILKGKGDIRNCRCNRAVKLIEHGMKVVERVLEKRLCRIVSVDEMQFGLIHERGTIDAVLILRRMQEEYRAKGKMLYMCFLELEKAFDSVGMVIEEERNTRSFGYIGDDGAKPRVRVDFEFSEEFEVKVEMH